MLIKRIVSRIYQYIDKKKVVDSDFLGVNLKCIWGTIRPEPEKDDAWLYSLVAEAECYYDIGANTGQTALMALVQGDKRVVLVDPNPEALALAAQNITMNGLGRRSNYFSAFVSSKNGEKVKFFTVGSGEAGSAFPSHASTARKQNCFSIVDTVTLDSICDYYGDVPDLVKVDVEGAELSVLDGAREIAKKSCTTFFVEMHALEERSMLENASGVLKWCKDSSYTAYYLKEHEILDDPQSISHRGRCHLLLLPKGKVYPEHLKTIPQGAPITPK